jgi:hypothetical protein
MAMGPPLTHPTSLSVRRAFVVEFSADANLQAGRVRGRVEHVVSGRATSFQSQEMLLAFMAQVLFDKSNNDSDCSIAPKLREPHDA